MRSKRQTSLDIAFPDGWAEGWAFGVPVACREALDIKLTARVVKSAAAERHKEQIWTRGQPPEYSFDLGDTFHAPAKAATLPWHQAVKHLNLSLQIVGRVDTDLIVAAIAYQAQHAQPPQHYRLSQAAFAHWLQHGKRPETATPVSNP